MRWLTTSAVILALTAGACLDPDVGGLQVPFCTNGDTAQNTDVSYTLDIAPLLNRSVGGCVMCHLEDGPSSVGIDIGGLHLSTYDTLMAGGTNSGGTIVVPFKPCQSVLYLKLTAAPPSGSRMPANGPPFFTTHELGLVHDWIAEGGHED